MAEVKQEGEFKVKPRKMKNLAKQDKPIKVDLAAKKEEQTAKIEAVKVDLTEKKEEDAVQTQETNDSDAIIEESKNSSDSEEVVEEVRPAEKELKEDVQVIQEITEEEVEEKAEDLQNQVHEAVQHSTEQNINLPENIQKVVDFMNETGGTLQDYVRLNADYSNISDGALLQEYYTKTKPYLEREDINLLLEDFSYDEELDDERDVRKKKIAYKEEIAKAKNYLEGLKSKYYDEIKLRPGVTQEQQKAMDFFNRYNEEQRSNEAIRKGFLSGTNNYFANEFKGFDFSVGEKKFRYNVKDTNSVMEKQSDLKSVIGKFLNDKGEVKNYSQYHKAIYAARNADTIAQHFYEQGKSDAVREITAKSNNVSTEVRQSAPDSVFVNGLKVKVIGGNDSSKLRIKKIKLNS
jgi:hypothetical protein